MAHLSEQDYQKILDILQHLYDPSSLERFSESTAGFLSNLVPADISGYCKISFAEKQFLEGAPLPIPHKQIKEVIDNHFLEHPIMAHQIKTGDLQACKLSDFVSQLQLHRLEWVYEKFLRPIGMEDHFSVALPDISSGSMGSICLFREECSFTERDRTVLNLLQPHLMQAHQTADTLTNLHQTQQKLQGYLNAAGSVVLNQEGRVHSMTQKAETLLKRYFSDITHLGQGLPDRLKQWVKHQRSLLTQSNGKLKPLIPLRFHHNGQQLTVRYVTDPAKEQHLLLLEEQQPPLLSIDSLMLCGLSRREAEVLFWVAEGKTNAEIAELLYLSVPTVRKHLEHIYIKMDVKTRAAAVVAVLKKLGLLTLQPPENSQRSEPHQHR